MRMTEVIGKREESITWKLLVFFQEVMEMTEAQPAEAAAAARCMTTLLLTNTAVSLKDTKFSLEQKKLVASAVEVI